MARDELSSNIKSAAHAVGHHNCGPTQDNAALTAEYTRHYSQINPLLQGGKLDFRRISERAGLKERKVREVILFRLLPDNMVQLLGRKEGVCFICSKKFQETGFQEPLCLTCLGMISMTIGELYPDGWESNDLSSAASAPAPPKAAGTTESAEPTEPMIPWGQYETALQEINQYRDQYGVLESARDKAETEVAIDAPQDAMESAPAFTEMNPSEPASEGIPLETVTRHEAPNDVLHLLNLDDSPEDDFAFAETFHEPIRHFGFQRSKPRR